MERHLETGQNAGPLKLLKGGWCKSSYFSVGHEQAGRRKKKTAWRHVARQKELANSENVFLKKKESREKTPANNTTGRIFYLQKDREHSPSTLTNSAALILSALALTPWASRSCSTGRPPLWFDLAHLYQRNLAGRWWAAPTRHGTRAHTPPNFLAPDQHIHHELLAATHALHETWTWDQVVEGLVIL